MPSVASEAHNILPSRTPASSRSLSKADNPGPAAPFADLLDSAPPSEPQPPRQSQSERPERADRADPSRRADDRAAEAAPAKDDAAPRTETGGNENADGDAPREAAATDDGAEIKPSAGKSADTSTEPKPDAQTTAALDAMFADPAAALVAPLAVAVAVAQPIVIADVTVATAVTAGAGVDAEALAALTAAAQAAGSPKATQPQTGAQGDAQAKSATTAGATDPNALVPQIGAAQDGQAQTNGEKSGGEFKQALASLLTKSDIDAPAVQVGNDPAAAIKTDVLPTPNVMTPAHTAATAVSATAAANAPAQAAAVPLAGLAVEIAAQAQAGKSHIEIRLDPAELGRINVHLEVDRDGNVSTKLVVERADTLDLLKRDAASLERALQQAGLKTSDNAMEFTLRQHAFSQDDTGAQSGARVTISDDDTAPLEALRQGYGRLLGLGGGLDIRV